MRQIRITTWDHRANTYSVQFFEVDDDDDDNDGFYDLKLRGSWTRITLEMIEDWLLNGNLPGPRGAITATLSRSRT